MLEVELWRLCATFSAWSTHYDNCIIFFGAKHGHIIICTYNNYVHMDVHVRMNLPIVIIIIGCMSEYVRSFAVHMYNIYNIYNHIMQAYTSALATGV